jgi:hypothetical protein
LMNEALKRVEAKYMAMEKKPALIKPPFFIFLRRKCGACPGRGHLRIGGSTN